MSSHKDLALALRRLGIRTRILTTRQVRVGSERVSGSRAVVDGVGWLHFIASTSPKAEAVGTKMRRAKLLAALTDRIPAVGILQTGELIEVRMPGWAFAALLRMVAQCDPKNVQTTLSEYLQLGTSLTPTDREIGSGVLSTLEGHGRSSSCTSDTDSN